MTTTWPPTAQQSNVDCFNVAAACVLKHLYDHFPRPIDIRPHEYQEQLVKEDRLPRACALTINDRDGNPTLLWCTIQYLLEEDIIRCRSGANPGFCADAILTAKGFTALSAPIAEGPEEVTTLGQTLGEAVSKLPDVVTSSTVRACINAIFAKLLS